MVRLSINRPLILGFAAYIQRVSVEEQIAEVAATILHGGDYGQCLWNPSLKKVHWVGGDSDFPSRGYEDDYEFPVTCYEDAQERFLAIPGVEAVELADEWYPDENEGWVEISYDDSASRIGQIEWLLKGERESLARWEAIAADPTHPAHNKPGASEQWRSQRRQRIARYEGEIARLRTPQP